MTAAAKAAELPFQLCPSSGRLVAVALASPAAAPAPALPLVLRACLGGGNVVELDSGLGRAVVVVVEGAGAGVVLPVSFSFSVEAVGAVAAGAVAGAVVGAGASGGAVESDSWLGSIVTHVALAIHGRPPRLRISLPVRTHDLVGLAFPDLSNGATFTNPVGILGGARTVCAVPPRAEGMAGYRIVPLGRSFEEAPPAAAADFETAMEVPPAVFESSSAAWPFRLTTTGGESTSAEPARDEEAPAACAADGDSDRPPPAAPADEDEPCRSLAS